MQLATISGDAGTLQSKSSGPASRAPESMHEVGNGDSYGNSDGRRMRHRRRSSGLGLEFNLNSAYFINKVQFNLWGPLFLVGVLTGLTCAIIGVMMQQIGKVSRLMDGSRLQGNVACL